MELEDCDFCGVFCNVEKSMISFFCGLGCFSQKLFCFRTRWTLFAFLSRILVHSYVTAKIASCETKIASSAGCFAPPLNDTGRDLFSVKTTVSATPRRRRAKRAVRLINSKPWLFCPSSLVVVVVFVNVPLATVIAVWFAEHLKTKSTRKAARMGNLTGFHLPLVWSAKCQQAATWRPLFQRHRAPTVTYSLCIKKKFTLCCRKHISRLWMAIAIIVTPFETRLQYQSIYVDIVFTLLAL